MKCYTIDECIIVQTKNVSKSANFLVS